MSNQTILLIDDETDIRDVLRISLTDLGYCVYAAENGNEALSIFDEINPPVVLTDIKMPGMDGIELLKRIKSKNPDTEVIMITGHGDIDLAIKSLKFQATDFITKPIDDDILQISLKKAFERIQMRQALKEYTENLEQLVDEKSKQLVEAERMAAVGETIIGLSHAIKNIVGGLKGGAFVLEKGIELNETQYLNQGWEMIKGNVEKIEKLSIDLLDYGKSAKLNVALCNPNKPLEEVLELVKPRAKELGIEMNIELYENSNVFELDSQGIHTSLLNLITNAIDSFIGITRSPKEIKVISRLSHGYIEYEISDNGCGIDTETLDLIFRRFFSTKGTRGTGIGLIMTKKIVALHGGEIKVQSKKDQGSTFTVKIPCLS